MKSKLYLFDFDGTITNKDTLFDFLKFSFPDKYKPVYVKHIPSFVLAKLKLKDNAKSKEAFISDFLKGKNKQEIEKLANNYFIKNKEILLRTKAIDFILKLKSEKNIDKYMVTASLDIWVEPFADYLDLNLISTKAKFEKDIFTGKFSTENCNYKEKENRINKEIILKNYDEILAFGDTKGDEFMLALSNNPHFRYFE